MKKHLSFLVFSAFILTIAIFTSCDKKNDNDNPVIPDPGIFTADCGIITINNEEYIQMCIVPDIVTANSTNKYRIENLSTKDLNYGTGFRLEYFDNNNWVEVDLSSLIPTGLLITTKAGEISEENFNIYEIVEKFNDAKVGKYRIIKDFNVPYPFATPEFSIPAEFIVKKEDTNLLP